MHFCFCPWKMTEIHCQHDILQLFRNFLQNNIAVPVAAMNALVEAIKVSNATTWMELERELRATIVNLKTCTEEDLGGRTTISLASGCDLFMRYVTRAFNMEIKEFKACKEGLLKRGAHFTDISMNARKYIAEIGHSFIQDGNTVLVHGISRVVNAVLLRAAQTTYFNVIVTEGRPNDRTPSMHYAQNLIQAGIPVRIIADSAVGVYMESTNMCLVGAEGVMENGGIVNKVGTFQIALVAHAMQKPFYVAVESYKFARMYPLSQRDMLNMIHSKSLDSSVHNESKSSEEIVAESPNVDFTPAKLITLLFTDIGVLTPAAVSDELIRLYQ